MKRAFIIMGISASMLAVVVSVFATGLNSDVMAQNTSQNISGLGVPLNTTGAESSPEAMNNTLTPIGPENETIITP